MALPQISGVVPNRNSSISPWLRVAGVTCFFLFRQAVNASVILRPALLCFVTLMIGTHSLCPQAQPARAGAAALFKAAEAGNVAEIRRALAQGVPVDAADSDGWTALMLAAGEGKLAAVQALVKGGADVNWAGKSGETALIVATASGHMAVVKYLLSEGADKTARTKQGLTAADVAERAKKPELAKLLQVAGRKPAAGASARAGDGRAELDAKISAAAEAFKAGRNDEAAKLFQEVVARDPQHAMAWHFLGQSLAAAGKKDDARAAYEKSLSLQPNGDLAERNTKMLASVRPRTEPNIPPEVSAQTRHMILNNPLFTSLPNNQGGISCTVQNRTEYPNGVWTDVIGRETSLPGTGGVYRNTQEFRVIGSAGVPESTIHGENVSTLGGLIGIVLPVGQMGTVLTEIKSADGTLFPLKTGNRFSYALERRWANASNTRLANHSESVSASCEVLEQIDERRVGVALGVSDFYRVRCSTTKHDRTRGTTTTETNFNLCSESLGQCPEGWDGARGELPANIRSPLSRYVGADKVTTSSVCSR